MTRFRLFCLLLVALLGGLATTPRYPAYFIAPFDGALPLRMEMVEETLYEEFPVHSRAYYEERNARLQTSEKPEDVDDFAVGLDILGRPGEAVEVLREKLERQQGEGRELYSTYANLGTALIHHHIKPAISGDQGARDGVSEGLDFIVKAVEVNPQAHYGREIWQMNIVRFLLKAMTTPQLLLRQDCLGNDLDPKRPVGNLGVGGQFWLTPSFGSRESITKIGQPPVPFDEPLLGIIGMWQVGGGANPHFSLAMAETLDRVGELDLAWTAYQRTRDMKERFWPDEEIQRSLDQYCEARQVLLEERLEDRGALIERYNQRLSRGLEKRERAAEFERRVEKDPTLDFYLLYRQEG